MKIKLLTTTTRQIERKGDLGDFKGLDPEFNESEKPDSASRRGVIAAGRRGILLDQFSANIKYALLSVNAYNK